MMLCSILILIVCFNEDSFYNVFLDSNFGDVIIENSGDDYLVKIDGCNYEEIVKLLNVEVHDCSEIADRVIIEGYTSRFKKYCIVDGLKTNIQMSVNGDEVLIGYPLIKGSF